VGISLSLLMVMAGCGGGVTTATSTTTSITTTALSNGAVSASYRSALTAKGGVTPYVWTISSGSLPPGLSLNAATGAITGTPSTPGSFVFGVKVTDSSSPAQSAATGFTIPILGVTITSLPGGTVGVAYRQELTATGGTSPYTWSITAGALPPGLSLSTGGTISGTPLAMGNLATFTVEAADSSGSQLTGTQVLSIPIDPSTTGVPNAITVAGGAPPVTGINFTLSTMTPTLGLADVGLCTGNPFPCSAGVASVSITHGTSATLWLVGQGLTTGGGSEISTLSVEVSHAAGSNDVPVSHVTAQPPGGGLTNITFMVTATSGATPGPRNIIVTNSATGELQVFVGAILIQ
jgi:hypothetical protein